MRYDEIRKKLPHEAPYVLLDRIESLEEKRIVALKNVSGCECFTKFHYPTKAIYPGVFLIEIVSQAAAILMGENEELSQKVPLLGGINHFYIQRPVVPGDQLIVTAEICKQIDNLTMIIAKIFCDGEIVASGRVSLGVKCVEEI